MRRQRTITYAHSVAQVHIFKIIPMPVPSLRALVFEGLSACQCLWVSLRDCCCVCVGKGQAEQQGGCFIFKGKECVYEYKDPATGRHVNTDEVLRTALQLV